MEVTVNAKRRKSQTKITPKVKRSMDLRCTAVPHSISGIHSLQCSHATNTGSLHRPMANTEIIEDLCSRLESLQLNQGPQTKECLGVIQNTACDAKYRHLIYRDP